jgi:hypothetical protein
MKNEERHTARLLGKLKPVIGRNEEVELPEYGLTGVQAKIDTGAYRSSLHCESIKIVRKGSTKYIKFVPLRPKEKGFNGKPVYVPYQAKKKVKSSTGQTEERYVIRTKVKLFGKEITTDFTLADRSKMKFPMLLGRKFLKGRFMVDVSLYHVASRKKKS